MKKLVFFLLIALQCQISVNATDLMDIYQQAIENDPTYKAAYSTYMAQSEAIPQARAALLPHLGGETKVSDNQQSLFTRPITIQQPSLGTYWKISASQTLFNYQAWATVNHAKASVKAAMATYNDAAENLILRSASAYFNLLLAEDTLHYAEAKKSANRHQLQQAQDRFNVGFTPITSVYEAQAAYDQSIAEVIKAKNDVINQNENLRKITNHVYEKIAPLRHQEVPLITPEPNDVNEWIATGLKQNYQLASAKYNLQAARENIHMKSAGNWPTIELQAQSTNLDYHNQTNNRQSTPIQASLQTVQIAMNFPAFQGGLVQSQTRQAQFDFQTSSEQLEKVYRDVSTNCHTTYNSILDGISRVKADKQTVLSQQKSLNSVHAQFEVGTRTMTDVVTAQEHLFQAQVQLATDQYNLLNALLYLKYLAGTLTVDDLAEINSWLATTQINAISQA